MSSPSSTISAMPQLLIEFVKSFHARYPKTSVGLAVALGLVAIKRVLFRKKPKNVRGKIVLITGGGFGLGRLMAKKFSSLGATVVLWDINEANLEETAKIIAAKGAPVHTAIVNVSDRKAVFAAVASLKASVGKIDILVNNAGVVSAAPIDELTEGQIRRTFDVNVFAHFWTIQAVLPDMIADNSGHICSIASSAGFGGCPRLTDYCASKFAAVGLDESLRRELRGRGVHGVKTTCIAPFFINTGMFDGVTTRFPWLLPILDQHYVANTVVDKILYNEAIWMTPGLINLVPVLRFLSSGVQDWISDFLGITHSMDDFKGRSIKA